MLSIRNYMIKSVRKSNFIPVSVLRPICLTTSLTNSLPLIRHHFSTTTNGSKNDKKNSDKKNSKVDALKDDTINDKTNDHIVISNEDELAKVVIDIFDSHKFESLNKLLINLQRNSEINTRKSLLAQERRSGIRKEYMWFYNLLWSATVDESAKLFPITVERYKSPDQQAVFARLMLMARATCLNVDVQNLPDGDEQLVNSLAAEMCTILPSHVISTLVADLDLFQTDKSITTKRLVHGLQLQLNSSSTGLSMLRQALAQPVRDSKASNNSHSISASDLADRFKAFFGSKTLTSPSTPIAAPSSSTKVDLPVKSTVEKVKTVPTSPSSFASNRAYMLSLFCHAVGERPNHSFENEVAQKSQQVKSYAQLMEEGQDADASLLRPYEERIASSTQLDSGISTNTGDSIIDDSLKFMLLHVPDGTDEATLCAAFKNIGKVAKVMLFVEPISVEETASRNVTKTKPVLAQGDPIDSELSKKFLHVKRDKVGAVKPFPVKGRVEKTVAAVGYAIVWMKDRAGFNAATRDDMRIFGVSVRAGQKNKFACCPVHLMKENAVKLYLECRQKQYVRLPTARQLVTLLSASFGSEFNLISPEGIENKVAHFVSIKFTSHDMAWRAFTRLKHHFGDEELFLVSWQQSQRYLKSVRRARQNSNEHIQQATRSFFAPKTIQVSSPKKTLIASADSKEVEVCSPSDSTTKPTNKPKKKDPKSSSVKKKVSKKKSDVNSEVKSSTETVQESPLMIHE